LSAQKHKSSAGRPIAGTVGMAGFKDFREIVAWQLARELRLLADALLAKPDVARRYKYCDQLSDAARSGPRNIAEINHFIDARDLKLMTDEEFIRGEHTARRAIKAASGLIRYLESTPDPPPPRYLPKAKLEDPNWGQD
jgi:hypothetical protein